MKKVFTLLTTMVLVLLYCSSCQPASPSESIDTSSAVTETDTSSVVTQIIEPSSKSEETQVLYDPCSTFVLSVGENAYPVNVPYIDVTVTATEAGCELTISNSYKICQLNNGEQTFVCYGGVETAAVFTPNDLSSIAQGSVRVDLDALRQNNDVHLEAGTYRIFFDDQYVDVVLTEE